MADNGRKFLLTINNPLEKGFTHDEIKQRLDNLKLDYWCMCDEIGEKGTFHTHVFIYIDRTIRFKRLKKEFPPAHIDYRNQPCAVNRNYLLKGGKLAETEKALTSIEGSFEEWGYCPEEKQGKRTDIEFLVDSIKKGMTNYEIIEQYPKLASKIDTMNQIRTIYQEKDNGEKYRDVKCIYQYGKTGTGKSRSIIEQYGFRSVYRITDYKHPFDGYKGEEVIVFEEFYDYCIPISDMLNYLDIYPLTLPSRYYNKQACFTKVYINSNVSLEDQYKRIQKDYPQTWQAFLRRIDKVYVYEEDSKKEYKSVGDYQRRTEEKWLSLEDLND